MKKLFFTFLTVALFAGYGTAQQASSVQKAGKTKVEAPTRLGTKVAKAKVATTTSTTSLEAISAEEQAFMNNLKVTNPTNYEAYLKEREDIQSLKKCLLNNKLNATEKAQLQAKLNKIETKYGLK